VADAVEDAAWRELEYVGFPVGSGAWPNSSYDFAQYQGPAGSPMPARDAAISRMRRGIPQVGWPLVTQAGRAVPTWQPHDPKAYADHAIKTVLDDSFVGGLFAPNVAPSMQAAQRVQRSTPLDGGPVSASDPGTSTLAPFGVTAVAAGNDPAASLALGFGTGYPL